jgi:putative ABC transport system ATP-binding protein
VAAPVISLRDITKSYGQGAAKAAVLRGVSLDVAEGELVALVGQSGSGKSTLLNIVGGLDKPDGGEVTVLDHHYGKTSESSLARLRNTSIGFVFQAFNLLDHLTCLGNVVLPAAFSTDSKDALARGREALARVGLGQFGERHPSELSGGQKQRVAIARALFAKPRLLLCDEPTGNLDSATGAEVIEFFQKLNHDDGVTLVIVTHERRVSSIAQRVVAMRDGNIVEGADADAATPGTEVAGPA